MITLWLTTAAWPVVGIAGSDAALLPVAPLHEEVLSLPGDPSRPATLQVTLFTPGGPGPFPLAIMNHGATHISATHRGERYRLTVSAYYFLSRGYAVALPMIRGSAESSGDLVRAGCDLAQVARLNGQDIRGVILALDGRPDIDKTQMVVAGQSFGVWNTLGVGTEPPAGVRGLVSFNAALRSSDCSSQDKSMISAAHKLGELTSLPSLWFYGDNDSVMPNATWRAVFDEYESANGHAELVAFGSYGKDSHQLLSFPASLPIWAPKVDTFLARIGLPSKVLYPDYLPHAAPPPTHWAALSDVAAIPFLGVKGRAIYPRFLQAPWPRAFAIAPNGSFAVSSGGYDPIGRALQGCSQWSTRCALYAVDDDVVWTGSNVASVPHLPSNEK